MREVVVLNWAQ